MSGQATAVGASRFQRFMNHPAGTSNHEPISLYFLSFAIKLIIDLFTGPKTVFFWAPLMKWCLVAAGVKDLSRPAEKLSVSQNVGKYISPFPYIRNWLDSI